MHVKSMYWQLVRSADILFCLITIPKAPNTNFCLFLLYQIIALYCLCECMHAHAGTLCMCFHSCTAEMYFNISVWHTFICSFQSVLLYICQFIVLLTTFLLGHSSPFLLLLLFFPLSISNSLATPLFSPCPIFNPSSHQPFWHHLLYHVLVLFSPPSEPCWPFLYPTASPSSISFISFCSLAVIFISNKHLTLLSFLLSSSILFSDPTHISVLYIPFVSDSPDT